MLHTVHSYAFTLLPCMHIHMHARRIYSDDDQSKALTANCIPLFSMGSYSRTLYNMATMLFLSCSKYTFFLTGSIWFLCVNNMIID